MTLTTSNKTKPVAVVAIGGNALIPDNKHTSMICQRRIAEDIAVQIVDMIASGWNVVLTHGNGPHVGMYLRSNELASAELPKFPLDHAVSATQGEIGYLLQLALGNELAKRHIQQAVVSVVTQVQVDPEDVSFNHPDKPIGTFMTEEVATLNAKTLGWTIVEDSGRGWRRVVPSPKPLKIIEASAIKTLIDSGVLVIACGGGGIPVIQTEIGEYTGVEAVIDKDRASAMLAIQLNADMYLVPTGVEKIAINFGKPNQEWLTHMTLEQAQQHMLAGQFPAGSMLPKVEAILTYLNACPKGCGLVTSLPKIAQALELQTGTRITV